MQQRLLFWITIIFFFSLVAGIPSTHPSSFIEESWEVTALGVTMDVNFSMPLEIETGKQYPWTMRLQILAINESHPYHPRNVSRVQFGYDYNVPLGGGMSSRFTWDEGNYSIGEIFSNQLVGPIPFVIPNNQVGLLPGQATSFPLHILLEFTVKSLSGSEGAHKEDYMYPLVVRAGSDWSVLSPLQQTLMVGGIILFIILIVAFAYKKKR